MPEKRNKILAKDILSAFNSVILLQGENVVPYFIYRDKEVNELLYKHYQNNKESFDEVFKPEWDRDYPKFPHFYRTIQMTTKLYNSNPEVRRLICPFEQSIKRELANPKLIGLALKIGMEFEGEFGCDETGLPYLRTQLNSIKKDYGLDWADKYDNLEKILTE